MSRLNAGDGLFKSAAMGPNEVEDASAEFNLRVQIVSPPPDQFLNPLATHQRASCHNKVLSAVVVSSFALRHYRSDA